jgi:phosphinothricin acetyltransferase
MDIRDARPEDFDAVADITAHYILHTAIHWGSEPVPAAELRASWQKGLGRYPYLVLVNPAGTVDAYAKAGPWRDRAAYDRTAEVGIYLRDGLQGRGLGKRLYAALIDRCRTAGFHALVGGVALPNPASARLHEGLGFRLVGVFHQVGWKFDRWHDCAFYERLL